VFRLPFPRLSATLVSALHADDDCGYQIKENAMSEKVVIYGKAG
jgi:hypothetical protein